MNSFIDVYNEMLSILKKNSAITIFNAKFSIKEIFSKVLNVKKQDLFLEFSDFDKILTVDQIDEIKKMVERRFENEPLDYILGFLDFYGARIFVDENVLIPRVETELLVDHICKILENLENLENKVLFDVCTGSGCIGIAIKKKFPKLKVIISDISPDALKIAKKNVLINDVDIEIKSGDLLTPFLKDCLKADFFVCNPPYISKNEYDSLDISVKDFEPKKALTPGETGLEIYKRLSNDLKNVLNKNAKIFLEIGYLQKEQIFKIFDKANFKNSKIVLDYSNKDRFFFSEIV